MFSYKTPNGSYIQIDLVPHWQVSPFRQFRLAYHQFPYMPEQVPKVKDLLGNYIPYLDPRDLMAYKFSSCGTRLDRSKKVQDAYDAVGLKTVVESSGSALGHTQKTTIRAGLDDIIEHSRTTEEEWITLL